MHQTKLVRGKTLAANMGDCDHVVVTIAGTCMLVLITIFFITTIQQMIKNKSLQEENDRLNSLIYPNDANVSARSAPIGNSSQVVSCIYIFSLLKIFTFFFHFIRTFQIP